MRSRIIAFIILTIFFILPESYAQEGHYWSENYGNKSMLLSGTVNASVQDLGAVFYNPARLGLIENPAFAISAQVYEWNTFRLKNGENEDLNINKSNFGGAPSLAAGTFKVPFLEGHKFAYSFLTRQRDKADFFVRIDEEGALVTDLPGEEIVNGKLDLQLNFKEEWIGLTWAPPTSKRIDFGLSTFISTLNKSAVQFIDINALSEFNQGAYFADKRRYSYESYGILWKLGFAVELSKLRLGLTVTTPRINAYGKGSTFFEKYLVGLDTTGDGTADDIYLQSIQDNLELKYKTPWAIGFGIGIPLNNVTIHVSGEWYSKIDSYELLRMNPFVGQSSGDTIDFVLVDKLNQVFNYGIGVEWHFSEKVSAYGSFALDHSAVPSDVDRLSDFTNKANNSVFQADYYHFGGGIVINTKAVEITLGATHKGASQNFVSQIDFPDNNGNVEKSISTIYFSQWRFILGFSFPFADKLTKKLEGGSNE